MQIENMNRVDIIQGIMQMQMYCSQETVIRLSFILILLFGFQIPGDTVLLIVLVLQAD
jgi:hypothetical protein